MSGHATLYGNQHQYQRRRSRGGGFLNPESRKSTAAWLYLVRLQPVLVVEGLGLGKNGADRVDAHDLDVGQTVLELPPDASERATRAS